MKHTHFQGYLKCIRVIRIEYIAISASNLNLQNKKLLCFYLITVFNYDRILKNTEDFCCHLTDVRYFTE